MATLKRNHHYVPQFWQKLFADGTGNLYSREGQSVTKASPKRLMSADWVYTVFDTNWLASDNVEDALSQAEGAAATAYRSLLTSASVPSAAVQEALRKFIALQACRHPDILGRGHRRSKELGAVLVKAHSMTASAFADALAPFAVDQTDAQALFAQLVAKSQDELEAEFQELATLSPHDPQLPHTDALLAQSQIETQLSAMDLIVLDAPLPLEFVLGDTPVPQSDLRLGFIVPVTRSLALSFQPPRHPGAPTCTRRAAASTEVADSNLWQFNNALIVTIGSNPSTLNTL